MAALTAGALFAQQPPASDTVNNPLATSPTAAAEGQQIYNGTCQTCHGAAGVGDAGRGGPALNVSGLKSGDSDADLFRTIRNGVQGTQMPPYKGLRDDQIWQLVTYLRSLQGTAASTGPARGAVTPEGDIAAGEALFYGRAGCASCHEINARGGITGPDLSNAGRLSAEAIRQKIMSPEQPLPPAPGARGGGGGGRGAPPPVTLVAKTSDGSEIRGVRRNEDTFSAQIVDVSGKLHLIDKRRTPVAVESRSLMPADYAQKLSPADITNLVGFLQTQRARDLSKTITQPLAGGVTYERLIKAKAEPHNWLMYWGDYQGTHYSSLNQITANNVRQLKTAWSFPILGGNSVLEATPIVVDGVMYTTGSGNPATVTALDARSGRQIWRWTRQQKVVNPYEINPFARGVAILGNRLFVGTLDGWLIALDARTGQALWEAEVADTMEGSSITSPPLVLKDMVVTGMTGGEYATRGFLDAYDSATGKRRWRFYTIPGTWRGRQRHLERRELEDRRRPNLASRQFRSRSQFDLLGGWKSRTRIRPHCTRRDGQSLQQFRRRAGCRYGQTEMALPVHARRWARLGFGAGHGPGRSHVARREPQVAASCRSQRPLLRAGPHERKVPVGHSLHLSELECRV